MLHVLSNKQFLILIPCPWVNRTVTPTSRPGWQRQLNNIWKSALPTNAFLFFIMHFVDASYSVDDEMVSGAIGGEFGKIPNHLGQPPRTHDSYHITPTYQNPYENIPAYSIVKCNGVLKQVNHGKIWLTAFRVLACSVLACGTLAH